MNIRITTADSLSNLKLPNITTQYLINIVPVDQLTESDQMLILDSLQFDDGPGMFFNYYLLLKFLQESDGAIMERSVAILYDQFTTNLGSLLFYINEMECADNDRIVEPMAELYSNFSTYDNVNYKIEINKLFSNVTSVSPEVVSNIKNSLLSRIEKLQPKSENHP